MYIGICIVSTFISIMLFSFLRIHFLFMEIQEFLLKVFLSHFVLENSKELLCDLSVCHMFWNLRIFRHKILIFHGDVMTFRD
jgi:hypothetical protein